MSVKDLVAKEPRLKALLKLILENPYVERKDLAARAELPPDEVDAILEPAVAQMCVLELASQAESRVESRVPKKVYLINPDIEGEVRGLQAPGG